MRAEKEQNREKKKRGRVDYREVELGLAISVH